MQVWLTREDTYASTYVSNFREQRGVTRGTLFINSH